MNNKDKSYFAKIILVSVVFIAFLTVLGLTAELVKNKRAVNYQPQISFTPEMAVTLAPSSSVTPISDNIANWQTYKNEEYGFELKYPTEGDYGFTELSKNEITSSCPSNDSCISCEGLSLTFNKETDPSCETSNMLIPTNNNDVKKEFSNKLNQEGWPDKKEINNLTFYRDYSDDHAMGGQEQREYTYKTLHNNECYKITLSLSLRFAYGFTDDCMNVPQSDFDTSFISKDLFFPILSTFNFTN